MRKLEAAVGSKQAIVSEQTTTSPMEKALIRCVRRRRIKTRRLPRRAGIINIDSIQAVTKRHTTIPKASTLSVMPYVQRSALESACLVQGSRTG
jgi:hypothetical protein